MNYAVCIFVELIQLLEVVQWVVFEALVLELVYFTFDFILWSQ